MFTFYGYSKNSGLRNYGVKYIDGSSGSGRTDEGGGIHGRRIKGRTFGEGLKLLDDGLLDKFGEGRV